MSAFWAVAYEDRIELLTDGAIYEDDGTLTDIRQKVWTCRTMAVTGRGNAAVVERLAEAFILIASLEGNFDRAIGRIADALAERTEEFPPFEMVIAGISEEAGPVIYYVASTDMWGVGFEPLRLYNVGSEFGGGNPLSAEEIAAAGIKPGVPLRDCGVALLEAMRRKPGINPARPDLPPVYGIGGHLDWTVVDAAGARTERLHEWPDVVGEKIEPVGVGVA